MPTTTTTQSSYLETVPLEEAKTHLRISSEEYDQEVERVVASAVDWCEHYTGRTLRVAVAQRTVMSCWAELCRSFPFQPVIEITALKYFDAQDSEQTVAPASYRLVKSDGRAALLELASDFQRPSLFNRSDAVQVEYTTGYATVADIPPRAKQAIKMMLNVYWGDLMPRDLEVWDRQAKQALDSLQWGAYR